MKTMIALAALVLLAGCSTTSPPTNSGGSVGSGHPTNFPHPLEPNHD